MGLLLRFFHRFRDDQWRLVGGSRVWTVNEVTIDAADVVHGDTMAPPQLPTDTPIVDVLQPIEPHFIETFGDNVQFFVANGVNSLRSHRVHLDEPLRRDERFNDFSSALTTWYTLHMFLGLDDQSSLVHVRPELLAAFEAIQACVSRGSQRIDRGVFVHDVDQWQLVLLAQGVVVRVVRGCDLQGARAKVLVDVFVRDDYRPYQKWGALQ